MLRTTVVSLLALGCALSPAMAQNVLWGESQSPSLQGQQQPFIGQPQIQYQPAQAQPSSPPLYYETVPQSPPPVYVEPQEQVQPVYRAPAPQTARPGVGVQVFRANPQIQPQTQPQAPREFRVLRQAEPQFQPEPQRPVIIARPEPQPVQQPPAIVQDAPQVPEPAMAVVTQRPPSAPPAPAQQNGAVGEFSAELMRIVELGERYRAASPGFLEDLKALAVKYEGLSADVAVMAAAQPAAAMPAPPPPMPPVTAVPPSSRVPVGPPRAPEQPVVAMVAPEPVQPAPPMAVLTPTPEAVEPIPDLPPPPASLVYLRDDFADGDYIANPAWSVRQGNWVVDSTYGLRPFSPERQQSSQVTPQALLQYLIGDEKPEANEEAADTAAGLIEVPMQIGNAFSLVATITDHDGEGAAHFILHQGGANWLGYRLELRAGPRPLVVLARRGASGYKDIMKVEAPAFTQGKPHQLRWARLSDGQMFVLIDGRPIITARDTVFKQPWKGFAYFTAESDISMRNIRIAEPIEQ